MKRLSSCAPLFGLVAILLAGCDNVPIQQTIATKYAQREHVGDPDVRRRVAQTFARECPEVYAVHRTAEREGMVERVPRLLKTVVPKYPFSRRWKDIQGYVWIGFVVDETGTPSRVTAIPDESGIADPAFTAAAIAAVKEWKFEPGRIAGNPAPWPMVVPIVFEML